MERFVGGKHLLLVAVMILTLGLFPASKSKLDAQNGAGDSGDVPLDVVLSPGPDFKLDVQPILARNCVKCHGTERAENGLRLDSYEGVMKGSKAGPMVIPENAAGSLLFMYIDHPATIKIRMPHDANYPLPKDDVKTVLYWIEAGALPRKIVKGPSFAKDVQPVLNQYCVKCHGPERMENGLRLDSYDGVMKGTAHGKIVEPGMASQSVLTYVLENPASMRLRMPHDTMQKLSPNRRKNIYYWIEDGAQNN